MCVSVMWLVLLTGGQQLGTHYVVCVFEQQREALVQKPQAELLMQLLLRLGLDWGTKEQGGRI